MTWFENNCIKLNSGIVWQSWFKMTTSNNLSSSSVHWLGCFEIEAQKIKSASYIKKRHLVGSDLEKHGSYTVHQCKIHGSYTVHQDKIHGSYTVHQYKIHIPYNSTKFIYCTPVQNSYTVHQYKIHILYTSTKFRSLDHKILFHKIFKPNKFDQGLNN